MFDMVSYIFMIVFGIAFVVSVILGIRDYKRGYEPDTFPDEHFTKTCKKYSTKEITSALDEISDGI